MLLFFKDQNGVAATEFALMAPFLLFMMIGIFDYGSYFNATMRLENTAFAIAQFIRAGGAESDIESDILLEGNLGLTADNVDRVSVDVSYVYECADPDDEADENTDCGTGDYLREYVVVGVSMGFETLIPYPGIPDTINLSGNVRLQNN